jgi:hypothetical protein
MTSKKILVESLLMVNQCNQPRCPITNEWIKKMWCIHTMEYDSAIKKNKLWYLQEMDGTGDNGIE